jgi:hypothetical protein
MYGYGEAPGHLFVDREVAPLVGVDCVAVVDHVRKVCANRAEVSMFSSTSVIGD